MYISGCPARLSLFVSWTAAEADLGSVGSCYRHFFEFSVATENVLFLILLTVEVYHYC